MALAAKLIKSLHLDYFHVYFDISSLGEDNGGEFWRSISKKSS